jgi:alanine-glyoxylate transaminase / serine-glyoxylate transaminase / serine-pyruvate transaminase
MTTSTTFHPPRRLLLGPGPSNVDERVLQAMAGQMVGYFDTALGEVTREIQRLLQVAFGTANSHTFPISGTGMAGMEAALINLLQPGDRAVIGTNGVFGDRMAQLADRCGAVSVRIEAEWGRPIPVEQIAAAAKAGGAAVIAVVHAETSTGVRQPLEGLRHAADACGACLLVDAVTSLAGHPVEVDRQGIDVCYAGTQKALSAPPGLAPITLSPRALAAIGRRTRPVQSFYLDLTAFAQYWETLASYHHTPPITFYYALLEALRIVEEEGLEARWARHQVNHQALVAGLEAMGLEMLVAAPYRLWTLNTVKIPAGVDDAKVRGRLLRESGIEIGGGLGALKGKIWRIGLMGVNARSNNVLLLLAALERVLRAEGLRCGPGVEAANEIYQKQTN